MHNSQFIIASGPVIIEDNKVLLNRHGETPEDQKIWKFVGGRVELEDYRVEEDILEQACVREVMEEMGIEIEIITPLKPMLIVKHGDPNKYVILIHYLAKRIGEIHTGDDIVEWGWFDINNLPNDCAPNIKPVIDNYRHLSTQKDNI